MRFRGEIVIRRIVAVVIPCYRVKDQILSVIEKIGSEVAFIFIVDDCCPENSGQYVATYCSDSRVKVIFHRENRGVGGATITGILAALSSNATIIVKVDGDGQIDPRLIPRIIFPITRGLADYAKGNRFYAPESLTLMPRARKIGNLGLSFLTKLSSGYWSVFDPTNGFFAIHSRVAALLNFKKIDQRYYFESDMLFRLNLIDAVVCDVPMNAKYDDEKSSLVVSAAFLEFLKKNIRNFFKRIIYSYFLKDFNTGSLALIFGTTLGIFGMFFGGLKWIASVNSGTTASAGTVMLAALTLGLGVNLIVAFINFDMNRKFSIPLHLRVMDEPVGTSPRQNLFPNEVNI